MAKYNAYRQQLTNCRTDDKKFSAWLTYQWAILTTDLEHCDNFRVAKVGDIEQEKKYQEARDTGCCGFLDVSRNYQGQAYRLGFNYGH